MTRSICAGSAGAQRSADDGDGASAAMTPPLQVRPTATPRWPGARFRRRRQRRTIEPVYAHDGEAHVGDAAEHRAFGASDCRRGSTATCRRRSRRV